MNPTTAKLQLYFREFNTITLVIDKKLHLTKADEFCKTISSFIVPPASNAQKQALLSKFIATLAGEYERTYTIRDHLNNLRAGIQLLDPKTDLTIEYYDKLLTKVDELSKALQQHNANLLLCFETIKYKLQGKLQQITAVSNRSTTQFISVDELFKECSSINGFLGKIQDATDLERLHQKFSAAPSQPQMSM